MNVRIKRLDPHYTVTLPRDAGRELEEKGRTVHLSSIDVEIVVEMDDGRAGFEFTFDVDQPKALVSLDTFEPQYDDHAPADALKAAAEAADDTVHGFLADIDLDFGLRNTLTNPGVHGRAHVASDLEVES